MGEIYCDCDGVLNKIPERLKRIRIVERLPRVISGFLAFLLGQPNKEIIMILRKFQERDGNIVIITARPNLLRKRLERWLSKNSVPYSELICIGPFRRKSKKLQIIVDRGISIGIDDEISWCKGIISVFSPDSPFLDKLGA